MADHSNTTQARPRKDITRKTFNKLTAIEYVPFSGWRCRCECGNERIVQYRYLKNGSIKTCKTCASSTQLRGVRRVHDLFTTYGSWALMKSRCYSPRNPQFEYYGGRGIKVCDRWRNGEDGRWGFDCFVDDMGPRPEGKTLDRIDGSKGYEPENCRWATPMEQAFNRHNTILITFRSQALTVAQWSRILGISANMIRKRIDRGWDIEKALTTKPRKRRTSTL
jgi:hypothetical protein